MEWYYEVLIVAVVIVGVLMAVIPPYSVWSSKKAGEADLAEANYAEQVAIAKANARKAAAQANKEAEIIEAEAVAESILTIGDALTKNEAYLRWQWIKSLSDTEDQIIYVPTEANLPILEAQRLAANRPIEDDDDE